MTEREILLDALEHEDPVDRAAYLDKVCAGRPALRARIEELLQLHKEDTAFLNVPVMEQLAAAEQSLDFLKPSCHPGSLGRLDHYEVLEMVGRGSTGIVLRARDVKLQRVVAIKALARQLAASTNARERFVREAQAAAAVRDDHVVAIYAVSDQGPVPYLVMEYIHGMTLEQRLGQDKPLQLPEILRIGMQLAAGLAAAHAQGLVHRDIKPANILLENSVQRVKIADFGLARVAAEADPNPEGTLAGTPLYMSPEQARGEPTDQRTDLFSLGSILYMLCARRAAFEAATTSGVLHRVRAAATASVRAVNADVPQWLADLIAKLHAPEPAARPGSAREVAELLASQLALLQQPPSEPQAGPPRLSAKAEPAASRWPRSPHVLITVFALLVMAALAVLALMLWQRGHSNAQGQEGPSNGTDDTIVSLDLRREHIPPELMTLAGGDATQAPKELGAVLGDGRYLLPHLGNIAWMEQSPDGKILAVPEDEELILFESPVGFYRDRLKGLGGRVIHVSFSDDSRFVAATTWYLSVDGAVRVWDLRTGKVMFTAPLPGHKISGATAFSLDGKYLVGEVAQQLRVWDVRTGEVVQTVPNLPSGCAGLCFSPDGRHLVASTWEEKAVRVFDWDGARLKAVRTLKGHSAAVEAVVYSPDGARLASGTRNEFILWDARSLSEIGTVQTPANQLAFSPDSRTLYAASTAIRGSPVHALTQWDVTTHKELPALSVKVSYEPVYAIHCLSRDGKTWFVAPGSNTNYIHAVDTSTGKQRFPRQGHGAPLDAVAISPNGRMLASAGEDRVVKLWNLVDGQVIYSLAAHTQPVWGLAFSPNGQLVASGSRDGTVTLWNVASGHEVRTLHGFSHWPSRLQFSADGAFVAADGEGGIVKRWDVASGQEIAPVQTSTAVQRCVAFSPDGKLLASGAEDANIHVHDLATGTSRTFPTPGAVNDLAFSPDSHTLAAVTDGPRAVVRLWNLVTGEETTWKGHTGDIPGLAFSPGGSLLATCADDGTVRLWDRTGAHALVKTIGPGPFGGPVRGVAFTPDGRYLATANANGFVYLLRISNSDRSELEVSHLTDAPQRGSQ